MFLGVMDVWDVCDQLLHSHAFTDLLHFCDFVRRNCDCKSILWNMLLLWWGRPNWNDKVRKRRHRRQIRKESPAVEPSRSHNKDTKRNGPNVSKRIQTCHCIVILPCVVAWFSDDDSQAKLPAPGIPGSIIRGEWVPHSFDGFGCVTRSPVWENKSE